MNKIFISGSISRKSLSDSELACLEQIVENENIILIGDAYGADRAVQQWLAERDYRAVIVYFAGENPRNNVGKWQTRNIPNPENLEGRSRYQLKDKAMADECDCAVMFWDGKSKGTKDNMDYMDKLNKKYSATSEKKIFYSVAGTFMPNVADEENADRFY